MVVSDRQSHDGDDAATALPSDVDTDVVDIEASQEVMSLLSEHVPLALLADLALPQGPASPQILTEEGLPDVAWWEAGEDPDEVLGADAAEPVPAPAEGSEPADR